MRRLLLSHYVICVLAGVLLVPSSAQAGNLDKVYSAVTIKVDSSDCVEGKYRAVIGREWGKKLDWIPSDCTGVFVDEYYDNEDNIPEGDLAAFYIRWSNSPAVEGDLPIVTLDLDTLGKHAEGLYVESGSSIGLPIRLEDGDGPYALRTGTQVKVWPYGFTNPDGVNALEIFVTFGLGFPADPEYRPDAESRMLAALESGKLESAPIVIRQSK
ncbi:MAG: hypothetical protein JSU96_08785 [Acidobacteriota bacterium]|nr:MAG: hypothetical protein JSU96_08785 [Acidobacteriota bacterium]